jgi:hypothetical protein
MFVAIPLVFSSVLGVGGSYYYFSSSSSTLSSTLSSYPKLEQKLQDEIKKGIIDSKLSIVKNNINVKTFNLKKSKLPEKINSDYLWMSIFKTIVNRNFLLASVEKENAKNTKEIELAELNKFINTISNKPKSFPIKDSSELPDLKQLYLKEKLIKNFSKEYKTYKQDKSLNRLIRVIKEYDRVIVEKNNKIKELDKSLKFPKKDEPVFLAGFIQVETKNETKKPSKEKEKRMDERLLDFKYEKFKRHLEETKNPKKQKRNKKNHNLIQPQYKKFVPILKGSFAIN